MPSAISPFSAKPAFLTCFPWIWGFGVFPPNQQCPSIQKPSHFIASSRPKSTEFFVQPPSSRFAPQALLSLNRTNLLSSPIVSCPTFRLSAPAKTALKLRVQVPIPPAAGVWRGFLPGHRRHRAPERVDGQQRQPAQGHGEPTNPLYLLQTWAISLFFSQ